MSSPILPPLRLCRVREDLDPGEIEIVRTVFAGRAHPVARIRAFIHVLVVTI
ncbi:hypothetical protein [Shinella sp.]|uniref:hypothetical protein n=1 Tax=Shinella sp. TaxID=1870904 RepID=UPI00301D92C5